MLLELGWAWERIEALERDRRHHLTSAGSPPVPSAPSYQFADGLARMPATAFTIRPMSAAVTTVEPTIT